MLEFFRNKIPVSKEQWDGYAAYFKRIEVPAKTVLLKEGQVSRKMFFISKGCVRVWFNKQGKDITFQFFFENSMVSSIESLRKNISSPATIETLEPCVLWVIQKKDLNKIVEDIKEVRALRDRFIDLVFERTFDYMKHFFASIRDSPEERYSQLLHEQPQIVQRVPQHYIASFLGISSVHLSRIKSKLARQKKNVR
jgi:CRP-like cAMP-binding protein